MTYPLPGGNTDDLHERIHPKKVEHLGLAYYQYLPEELSDDGKAEHLKALRNRFSRDGPWKRSCEDYAKRLKKTVEAFEQQGRPVETVEAVTATRLLMGMGYNNALEVGLTIHQPGGFPYLPGSSVKGVCRSWIEEVMAPDPSNENALTKHRQRLLRLFGSASKDERAEARTMQTGCVCFLDAVPVVFPKLDVDLMTPHFGDWYMDGEAPGDWHSPTIIPFLAVAPEVTFRFHLVGRPGAAADDVRDAREALEYALTELGIGAKTAAGYGYFRIEDRVTDGPVGTLVDDATENAEDGPARPDSVEVGDTDVSAQVLGPGNRAGVVLVRLHVAGYEEKEVEAVGSPDRVSRLNVGDWVQGTVDKDVIFGTLKLNISHFP